MNNRSIPLLIALAALLAPYIPGVPLFWVSLLNYIGLAALVTLGLVVLTGVGGMTSFGQAAFVGISAYTTAVLSVKYGISPWLTLPVSILLTTLSAFLIGLMTVRLSGHYLPLGTIAWGIAISYLFGNLEYLGRYNGISGVPPLSIGGIELIEGRQVYPVVWLFVTVSVFMTRNLLDSRTGRAMSALRSGKTSAEAFGVNTTRTKLIVFVYAGVLAGLAGWLFAHIQRAVTPSAFGINAGIEYLLMAVVGGAGHVYGAIVGAAVVVLLKNQLQDILPVIFGQGGNFESIAFGALLILALIYARDGIWAAIDQRFSNRQRHINRDARPLETAPARQGDAALLTVEGLTKRFGGLAAVNDVGFKLKPGEILGLLGPNGAGKSTTFNLLTGVIPLTEGKIWIDGVRVDGMLPEEIAARGVARTFQHVKLAPEMTVLENVALGAHLRGHAGFVRGMLRLDREEEERIFAEAMRNLERTGLADDAFQLAGNLSLGASRMAEIARALCLAPSLLLLDEPAAGLRRFEKEELAKLLSSLRADGMGILLVEHDMEFVMGLTDRIVVLDFGTRIAEGTPTEIQRNPAVQEAYLGGLQ
ncbi:MAG: branched-chain amino acid ABC transporter ATP-binding protein/permease [Hoeflea sp.]|uniref:branched-chain amino acid ABC transporter ATP-binding protein/permease n=1 Tax=Hoeflea sp. TaxID=1940281 RepID=UPI00272F483C|nr:branched-chain amino acid ABC transporter ATP-binding protein/permease [Hoeflea sp.]MDP2119186.1 branched-chain amino acid ABC transporter ATP-binding protein/permease [Hoeflea sp.]